MLHFSNSVVHILRYMTEESNYTPQEKGTMNSQKKGLYLEIQHTKFLPLKGKKIKAHDWGLMNHMQNLLNNIFGKIKGAHERGMWKISIVISAVFSIVVKLKYKRGCEVA